MILPFRSLISIFVLIFFFSRFSLSQAWIVFNSNNSCLFGFFSMLYHASLLCFFDLFPVYLFWAFLYYSLASFNLSCTYIGFFQLLYPFILIRFSKSRLNFILYTFLVFRIEWWSPQKSLLFLYRSIFQFCSFFKQTFRLN